MLLSKEDLAHVRRHTEDVWEKLRESNFFITGANGFFGRWLIETLLNANGEFQLGCRICALVRNYAGFREAAPHIVLDPAFSFVEGNIRDFSVPSSRFDYLIHAAASTAPSTQDSVAAIDTEILGFQRVFSFAATSRVSRVLFISSGAVYGSQQTGDPIPEDAPCTLDPTNVQSIYGELKRFGELYGVSCAHQYGLEVVLARCFSAFGPCQNLNTHFAIANFIRDAIAGRDIIVSGDGTDERSYLYAADLAIHLWRLLVHGRSCAPYNVGSVVPISIYDLANIISDIADTGSRVRVLGRERHALAPRLYVPNTDRAYRELRLRQWIDLEEGIRRTLEFNRRNRRRI